ncbi:MAG TPA: CGNR zinc finger domain-containing protein [Solirubrobacteraceae bacterium]|nr:CGNR zinc finger domain-containing protein [Solirubrobacteraceae bacterium]
MFGPDDVLAFANTRLDRPGGLVDRLREREDAARWLAEHLHFAPARGLTADQHRELLRFRDAARRLIQARSAGTAPPRRERAEVNRASAGALRAEQLGADWQASVRFGSTGSERSRDLAELLAGLAHATIALVADPTADLAECAADDCVVLFLRTDPRRRWHSTRCGNRVRAARSYARHRPAAAPGTSPP